MLFSKFQLEHTVFLVQGQFMVNLRIPTVSKVAAFVNILFRLVVILSHTEAH